MWVDDEAAMRVKDVVCDFEVCRASATNREKPVYTSARNVGTEAANNFQWHSKLEPCVRTGRRGNDLGVIRRRRSYSAGLVESKRRNGAGIRKLERVECVAESKFDKWINSKFEVKPRRESLP